MKYIFVAGAPGSKWSSVTKNIYYSPDIDTSDYSDERTYYHDASGKMDLMHLGAYFDPGMEFGSFFDNLKNYRKEMIEAEFDRPFKGQGIRIIKSHVFANQIDFLNYWGSDNILGSSYTPLDNEDMERYGLDIDIENPEGVWPNEGSDTLPDED